MKWILHIGSQKTGSKVIQRFLSDKYQLHDTTIFFPKSGRNGVWHQELYFDLISNNSQILDAIVAESQNSVAEFGIISWEAMYRLDERAIDLLYKKLVDIKIVYFIRKQERLLNSMLNQLIKAHKVNYRAILDFEQSCVIYNDKYDHYLILKKWESICGKKNIIPIIYDKSQCSLNLFFSSIGIDGVIPKAAECSPNPNSALNIFGLSTLKTVKKLNKKDALLPHLVTVAHQELKDCFIDTYKLGDFIIFPNNKMVKISSLYRDSNQKLHEHYFPHLEELFPDEKFYSDLTMEKINIATIKKIFTKAKLISIFSQR
jgi:hypothetical protein